jgi:ribonuclease HI
VNKVTIYTDGSCRSNPGRGGWAAIVVDEDGSERELAGYDVNTTNNRMEMTAAIMALKSLKGRNWSVELISDSQYLVRGASEWKSGWKKYDFEHVKNPDLWKEIDALSEMYDIVWTWVRGHSGNHYNERCDALANAAANYVADAMQESYFFNIDEIQPWLVQMGDGLHLGMVIVKEESRALAAKKIADMLVPHIEKNLKILNPEDL